MPALDTPAPDPEATATAHLTRLTEHLTHHGLHARVRLTRRGCPQLIVVNPDIPVLTENVYAAPQKGTWWYWWSWTEKIAPADQPDAAANRIGHVLTPAPSHQ